MDLISYVLCNGAIIPISEENRERMKLLARKISLVFDLTPVMLGYHNGSFNNKPLRTLLCMVGVAIS